MRDFRKTHKAWWAKTCPDGWVVSIPIDTKDEPKPMHGDRWGKWEYDAPNKCIFYDDRGGYWIALDRLDSVEKVGQWCVHMEAKNWITEADLANLIYAAIDLCGLSY